MSLRADLKRMLEAELRAHGVLRNEWSLSGGDHLVLSFAWQGSSVRYVCALSPSDHRGNMNSVTQLRKRMGVRRVIVKNHERRLARRGR